MTLRVEIIRDQDRGAKELLGRLADAGKLELRVGIQGKKAAEVVARVRGEGFSLERAAGAASSGPTVVEIAAFHEFGRGRVPERSFLRSTVDTKRRKLEDLERRLARRLLEGTITERKGLGLIGAWLAAQIQSTIQRGIAPRLKDSTLERKGPGKTTPLIDTGRLVQSITWKVGHGRRS